MIPRLTVRAILVVGMAVPPMTVKAEDGFVTVGKGCYATMLPSGAKEPPPPLYKTENVRGPVPTNQWWSSLVWMKFSEAQYPHPLAVRAVPAGMQIYYPGPAITANKVGIFGEMPPPDSKQDFILGHSGQDAFPDARLHDYSDWFVTASFTEGDKETGAVASSRRRRLLVSYGHGSPYVYALYEGGNPRLFFRAKPTIWSGNATSPVLGISVAGRNYGLFAPRGSRWSGLDTATWTCDCGGKPYFSIAVLPEVTGVLDLFARHAHAHVVGTKVDGLYDAKTGKVSQQFTFTTKAFEGEETNTLFALYPHQWRAADIKPLGATYKSVRGVMMLANGKSFATQRSFPGVLFALPGLDAERQNAMRALLQEEAAKPLPGMMDTYGAGKRLGKVATLAAIADTHGDQAAKRKFLAELKTRLQAWFGDGRGKGIALPVFHYNRSWGTLIGYPAAYGSDVELNDHHFHYGYFLRAAAEVARHDPAWAAEDQWGGMVRMLIRDIATADRRDKEFPFLRNFDLYAGHTWASGHGRFGSGNNQESSSEAMNAWTALVLWGEVTGDRAVRDLGIYLHTTELAAINEYWFDVTGQNRPKEYTPSVVTMVWGGKSVNETWFSAKPIMVHGINWLPIHGGSLYLGQHPEYVRRNYQALVKESGGEAWNEWADLALMYLALDDPRAAIRLFDAAGESLAIEGGNSRANLLHWLHSLDSMGQVQRDLTANYPVSAVFRKGKTLTYVAQNAGDKPRTVTFSDGTKVHAPPRSFGFARETR